MIENRTHVLTLALCTMEACVSSQMRIVRSKTGINVPLGVNLHLLVKFVTHRVLPGL